MPNTKKMMDMKTIIKILFSFLLFVSASVNALCVSYPLIGYPYDTEEDFYLMKKEDVKALDNPLEEILFQDPFAGDNPLSLNIEEEFFLLGAMPPKPGDPPVPVGNGLYILVLLALSYSIVRYKKLRNKNLVQLKIKGNNI